ncbi:MAG: glutathione S-transferase family protein [Candidimonas sp.]|nr:MAG: glutathione S-transferase family protein [Candidimonas sp.]
MKLYFSPGACSMATWISLEWIGKPYDTHKVDIHGTKSPELLDHSPIGTVPMIEDGGWWLTENVAVLNYLIDRFPDAHIGGDATPKGRAELNRWLGFINSDMHPVFKPLFGSTGYLGDAAMVEKSKANSREVLSKRFGIIDKHLAGRDWLAGARHSVADAYLYVLTTWAPKVGIDISKFKHLQAFIGRMKADAGVKHVLDAEAKA